MDYVCIEDFLNLSIFRCKLCDERCKYPVMVVEKNGNYCSTCYTQVRGTYIEENKEINIILQKLIVPCQFYESGCNVTMKFVDIKDHENVCKFRRAVCPFSSIQQCDTSIFPGYCEHFNASHNNYTLMSENDTLQLSFNINVSINFTIIRVLVIHNEYFLLHMKLDPNNKKISLAVYYYGTLEELKNYKCIVKQVDCNISTEVNLLHESEYVQSAAKINEIYHTLGNSNFNEINLILKINTTNGYDPAINKTLLETLKCSRCKTYPHGKIMQCNAGHKICSTCSGDPPKCSDLNCNATCTGVRNYTVEHLSQCCRYPCRYNCSYCYYSSKNLVEHEKSCYLRNYYCPFTQQLDCQWVGKYEDIKLHLENYHHDNIVENNICTHKILLRDIENKVLCFITFNNIFIISVVKTSDTYCFKCKYVAPATLSNRFMFEVGLINQQNRNNKLIVTNSWLDTDESLIEIHHFNFKQYVAKSEDILISFQITYKMNYINLS